MDKADQTKEVMPTWNDGDCYDISVGVGKSRRYHAYMRQWYRRCHSLSLALTAIAGSAAFVALLPETPNAILTRVLTAIVAVAAISDLILDWSKKADLHDELCRKFSELAAKMQELPPTEENRSRACAERIRIEADEPTERRLIDLWAHNDEHRARGVDLADLMPLSWWQRTVFAYSITFGLGALEARLRARANARSQPSSHDAANNR